MDISQLLPLLGGNEKAAALLPLLSGDKSALINGLASSNPDAAKILGLVNAMGAPKADRKPRAPGVSAVADFAGSDIVGMLYKILYRN